MSGPTPARTASRPRRLARVLLLVSVTLLLGLGAVEVAMRVMKYPFSESWAHLEVGLSRFDEELGWVYRPNQSLKQKGIDLHFDAMGARVGVSGVSHDPDAPTALFVGGSFTFGHGLRYEATFIGQLAAMPELSLQMVNLGVQAYGTDQALLRLKRRFHDFDTKVVVYTFISSHVNRNGNDDRRILYPEARFLSTKPRFGLASDGSLSLERTPILYEDLSYIRVWAAVRVAWQRYGPRPTFELTRKLVEDMRDFVESNGATFLVVHWLQDTPMSRPLESGNPLAGLDLKLIDPSVDAPPRWDEWKIPRDGHPNGVAHRYVASLLAAELRALQ